MIIGCKDLSVLLQKAHRISPVLNFMDNCGTVLNLTEEGSFIQAQGSFSIGDTITVAYQLDSGPIREVRRPGTIKRITEEGIGVKFTP